MSGCSKSFLDKQPEDTLAPAIFFKTPKDIKTGVIGVYQPLQNIFDVANLPHMIEQMSDDGGSPYDRHVWHTFYKDNTNSNSLLWDSFYKMIVNANNIIDIIDKFESKNSEDAAVVKAYRGEASFLRALAYFYLVRIYGDVPMVATSLKDPLSAFGIGRTPTNDIYNTLIIPDLESAFENCYKKGDGALANEEARATKGAALTILGKVYLTIKNYAKASETLKQLIVDQAGGVYSLLNDYSQIWLPANKFNAESIFEINYNAGAGTGSYYSRNMSIAVAYLYGGKVGYGLSVPEKNLMDEFDEYNESVRYKVTADSGLADNLIQPAFLKLSPPLPKAVDFEMTGTDYNYMITRYADALLMYAEALMELGETDLAATYINQVRARVNMPDISAMDLNIERILHERRMELAGEGHRFFDLVRTGKAIEYLSADLISNNDYEGRSFRSEPVPEYQLLLPIPVGEIEKDQTLTQNAGY